MAASSPSLHQEWEIEWRSMIFAKCPLTTENNKKNKVHLLVELYM